MYVSKEVIYLQLQKTACTHIASVLARYLPGEQMGKHGPLTIEPRGRAVIGSIRNPWDWYVSLWAYGCAGKGKIYQELTSPALTSSRRHIREAMFHPGRWSGLPRTLWSDFHDRQGMKDLYASADDPQLFRRWLKLILGRQQLPYLEEGYPHSKVAEIVGLMTYRFLGLFCNRSAWPKFQSSARSMDDVREFYETHALAREFVRMEHLEDDLAIILKRYVPEVDANSLRTGKTNTSSHREFRHYFDEESILLVAENDALIIELFSYEQPQI